MKLNDVFKKNTYVLLQTKAGKYNVRVIKLDTKTRSILLTAPKKDGEYIFLESKTPVEIEAKSSGSMYLFETSVVGTLPGKIPTVVTTIPKKVIKIQRRRFVRIPLLASIEIKRPDNLLEGTKTTLVDISAGGFGVISKDKYAENEEYIITLEVGNFKLFKIKSRMVRIGNTDEDLKATNYGFEFIDIAKSTQDRILKFIFERQRAVAKLGFKI